MTGGHCTCSVPVVSIPRSSFNEGYANAVLVDVDADHTVAYEEELNARRRERVICMLKACRKFYTGTCVRVRV